MDLKALPSASVSFFKDLSSQILVILQRMCLRDCGWSGGLHDRFGVLVNTCISVCSQTSVLTDGPDRSRQIHPGCSALKSDSELHQLL